MSSEARRSSSQKDKKGMAVTAAIVTALTLVMLAGLCLEVLDDTAYSTVAGDSMQHGVDPCPGIIDDGDGILLTPVNGRGDIVTYYQGQRDGHASAGDYGDAISFKAEPLERSFVHRAVLYFRYNLTGENATADVPELGVLNATALPLSDYGFKKEAFTVDFRAIYDRMQSSGYVVLEGYITKGDNRNVVDQMGQPFVAPVSIEKVSGTAKPLDNEVAARSPAAYICMMALLLSAMMAYAVWLWLWLRGKTFKGFDIAAKCIPGLLAVALFARFMAFEMRGPEAGRGEVAVHALSLVVSCLAFAALPLILRTLAFAGKKESAIVRPILSFAAFVPYFFVFKAAPHIASFTFVALLMTWALYNLRPDRFFVKRSPEAPDRGFTYWGVTLGLVLVTFIFLLNYALPPAILLVLGWAACCGHGALRLWQVRSGPRYSEGQGLVKTRKKKV